MGQGGYPEVSIERCHFAACDFFSLSRGSILISAGRFAPKRSRL